ncbi:MAG: NAD(P)-dependent alcohol dehydrogenase [Microthrixaceae bacterium]
MTTYSVRPEQRSGDEGDANTTPVPVTMDAVTQYRYGSPAEVLGLEVTEVPEPGPGEVLVRVRAAGVDQGTWHLVAGMPYVVRASGFGLRRPKCAVAGLDFAGEVVAVGEGVTDHRAGDEVFGIARGSFAQYAVAEVDRIAPKPEGLSFAEAAVLGVSGLAALQAVRDEAGVAVGDRVLVIGASGGVGSYAVQIAKSLGAEVTAVAGTAKLDLVRSLGADHVIDYTAGPIGESGGGYDVVIDIAGNRRLRELRGLLAERGRLVIVGGEGGGRLVGGVDRQVRAALWSLFSSKKMSMLISSENSADLRAIGELVDAGALVAPLQRTYPLSEAVEAIENLRLGRVRGKIALEP